MTNITTSKIRGPACNYRIIHKEDCQSSPLLHIYNYLKTMTKTFHQSRSAILGIILVMGFAIPAQALAINLSDLAGFNNTAKILPFSTTKNYAINETVYLNGKLYRANVAVTASNFDATK